MDRCESFVLLAELVCSRLNVQLFPSEAKHIVPKSSLHSVDCLGLLASKKSRSVANISTAETTDAQRCLCVEGRLQARCQLGTTFKSGRVRLAPKCLHHLQPRAIKKQDKLGIVSPHRVAAGKSGVSPNV